MEDDSEKVSLPSPEVLKFLAQPMTRVEVIQLLQPLRSIVLSLFRGSMLSMASMAKHSPDEEMREKANEIFKDLDEVFAKIEEFDERLGTIINGKLPWESSEDDATHE